MGYEYDPSDDYSFLSRKPLTFLEQAVGQMVWVINGSPSGPRKRTYTLRALYSPDQIIDTERPDFEYIATGTAGHDFQPAIELNDLPWFPAFLQSQSNFSLGINEIQDSNAIEQFTAFAKGDKLSSVAASVASGLQYDIDTLDPKALEGGPTYVSHLRRERNRALVIAKREQALAEHGQLRCEACDFDFSAFYGALGKGFCEVHHKTPLGSLKEKRITRMSDLAIVCSNCHRILHRSKPMASVSELKAHVERMSPTSA